MGEPSNRRKHPRVGAPRLAATVRMGEQGTACLLQDISHGGLSLRTEKPFAVGTLLSMALLRPGWRKPLQLSGRVVSVTPRSPGADGGIGTTVGVAFEGLLPASLQRLEDLLVELGANEDAIDRLTIEDDGSSTLQVDELVTALEQRTREVAELTEKLARSEAALLARDEQWAKQTRIHKSMKTAVQGVLTHFTKLAALLEGDES
jgi:Tfp pilus assembly protein PilZ